MSKQWLPTRVVPLPVIPRDQAPSALVRIGPPAVEPLITLLNDPDENTRRLVAKALNSINDPRGTTALLAALQEKNTAAIAGAYQFYVDQGKPGSENALVEALNRFGDQAMAEYLLNCGSFQLEEAARAWAAKHYPQMQQQVYGVVLG
jgi:HEAT repeat protein